MTSVRIRNANNSREVADTRAQSASIPWGADTQNLDTQNLGQRPLGGSQTSVINGSFLNQFEEPQHVGREGGRLVVGMVVHIASFIAVRVAARRISCCCFLATRRATRAL